MKKINNTLQLSATDLVGHLNCGHLTALDVQVATGAMKRPESYDPLLEILRESGQRHEDAYIQHLQDAGHQLVIPPFLMGSSRRIQAAVFSFIAGVIPPMPMLGRSLL